MRMSPKTILFASELGGGIGHVAPLAMLADRLGERDTELRSVFVAGNGLNVRTLLGKRYPLLSAPVPELINSNESHSASYAEVLGRYGYTRKARLRAAVAAWDDLFDLLQPNLLIVEHSPTAALAARGRIPTVWLGNGYTLPPIDMPLFPAMKDGMAPPTTQNLMLENINAVLTEREQSALHQLPELLTGNARALLALPQLDPYAAIRKEPFFGSYHGRLGPSALPDEPHIFIYAGADESLLNPIVQAVTRIGCRVSAYLGNEESPAMQFLRMRGATVFDQPPPLGEMLRQASLVISHGGSGLAHAALMIGRPQLVVPIHAESALTAGRLSQLGVAEVVERTSGIWQVTEQQYEFDLKKSLEILLQVRSIAERAQELAQEIADMNPPEDPLGDIADICQVLLAR